MKKYLLFNTVHCEEIRKDRAKADEAICQKYRLFQKGLPAWSVRQASSSLPTNHLKRIAMTWFYYFLDSLISLSGYKSS